MRFYRRWIADFQAKTASLPLVERGAYSEMLDFYYSTEQPLPSEKDSIYRLCRAFDQTEHQAVDRVLSRFFVLQADGYHNKRADEELARDMAYKTGQRERSQLAVAAKHAKRKPKVRVTKPNGHDALPDQTPVLERIPCIDGDFEIHASFASEMERLFPSVDVLQTVREIRAWSINNPQRRKTLKGIRRHINSWLNREQNRP